MDQEKPNGVQVTPSTEGAVQVEGKLGRGKKGYSSPKTSQKVLLACRLEYELGEWKSVPELGARFGIHEQSLYTRIRREGWKIKREQIITKAQNKVEQQVVKEVSEADSYLKASFKRAVRYEEIADASIAQAATNENGVPLVDPEMLDVVTRSLTRLHELAKSSLRLPTVAMDITSNGQGLGDSFISAIAKLREAKDSPKIGEADLGRVLEAELE